MANGQKRKNLIPRLLVHGDEEQNFEEIANGSIQFFSKLYIKENVRRLTIDNLFEAQLRKDMVDMLRESKF